jgi:hypothetical protein
MRLNLCAPIAALVLLSAQSAFAFTVKVHQNMPEDALLYMEFQGSNQMRWVADYVNARAGGRYTGSCVNINYTAADMSYGNNIQCGSHGIARVGGVKPDYFWDAFWDDLLFFNWHVEDFGIYSNNFSSWFHFVNLLKTNDDGNKLVTSNYNKFDGYAYNQTYGFPNIGIDYLLAVFMNNAQMTVNLPNCTHSNCSEWQGISSVYKANPATDYKQNGSTTPVSSGSGNKATEQQDGTNYNCFSDVAVIGNCPDVGAEYDGTYQYANVQPGAGSDVLNFFKGDQDWVIYEPATNASAFYYNEMWLEGLASKNHSLQTAPIVGRYYSVSGPELLYFTIVHHWAGDMTQQSHIWSTIGYNHGDYESYADGKYGNRLIGGSDPNTNYENYIESQAYANARQNRYSLPVGNIDRILMEQVFLTYYARLRAGHDTLTSSNNAVWTAAATLAVRYAVAEMALINEKAVLDLRKCRNTAACNNS